MSINVQIDSLTKDFTGFKAVDNLSFEVKQGEVLGFLGPNGAGKTTSMRMIAGFLTPTSGTAKICGHDVLEDTIAAQAKIGYVPEGAPLYPDMTPKMFLTFIGQVRGLDKETLAKRLEYVANKLHLHSMWNQTLDTLSKGFKRRVALAQAILHDPQVLILDEPTDGLDPLQKREIRALIMEMAAEKIIIISTHILEEVTAICTRAMIISGGKILADEVPSKLAQRDPKHLAVTLKLKGAIALEQVQNSFSNIPYIAKIETISSDDSQGLLLFAKDNQSIVQQVSDLIKDKQLPVESISENTGQLDTVFCDIIANS